MKAIWMLCVLGISDAAVADSLVLGNVARTHVIESAGPACVDDEPKQADELESICMYGWWLWTIDIERTVGGPKVHGRVRAARIQHSDMLRSYEKAFRLFVLKPIESIDEKRKLKADYYLVDQSPEMYCMWHDPQQFGLNEARHVDGSGDDKEYCFDLRPRDAE